MLRIFQIIIVALGSVITYLGFRAYRKRQNKGMLFISLGFTLITGGSLIAGVLFEFLGYSLLQVEVTAALATSMGFSLLVYSIYRKKS
ncbi:MAG: hypothetical protein HYU02_03970 [Thaumarchaeota archaeon]|nr:hypothetical protein [Nitrososphaerota archaeon]